MKRRISTSSGDRGLTRAERAMGNTREDRELIASVNTLPRGRRYRVDMEVIGAGEAPAITEPNKIK